MKTQIVAALFALGLLASNAQASALQVTGYQRSDADAVIELEANAELGEPWVRIEGRTAKVWFPNVHDVVSYERVLEAGWVNSIRLRPGAHDTAVLRVELTSKQPLTTSHVEITRTGARAVVRLMFPTTPAGTAKPMETATAAKAADTGAEAAQGAEAAIKPTAETKASGEAPQVAAAATAATAAQAATTTPAAQTAAAPAQTAATKTAKGSLFAAKSAASKQFSDAGDPRTLASGAGLLVVIALALGMVYAWLRGAQKRAQGGTPAPKIEIISTKRVGPRHQLVMVRALGEDHLLSLNGGRAEHIASAPSPVSGHPPAAEAARPAARPGVFPMFASNAFARLQRNADNAPPASEAEEREAEAVAFGGELKRLVQRWKSEPTNTEGSGVHADSEAVAGIARLRRRAG